MEHLQSALSTLRRTTLKVLGSEEISVVEPGFVPEDFSLLPRYMTAGTRAAMAPMSTQAAGRRYMADRRVFGWRLHVIPGSLSCSVV